LISITADDGQRGSRRASLPLAGQSAPAFTNRQGGTTQVPIALQVCGCRAAPEPAAPSWGFPHKPRTGFVPSIGGALHPLGDAKPTPTRQDDDSARDTPR